MLGDLNFILAPEEKEGGNIPLQSDLDFSNALLQVRGIHSMQYIGNPYTWTNNRNDAELILERLDMACVSVDFFDNYQHAGLYHINSFASDHCPIILVLNLIIVQKKSFSVNKTCFSDSSCSEIMKTNWGNQVSGSSVFKLIRFLIDTKHVLKDWNCNHFGNITIQITRIQSQLSMITRNRGMQNSSQVKEFTDELKFWYDAEADFWKQMNMDTHLKYDDRNTTYFHQKANFRKRRTQIDFIQCSNGTWCSDREDIYSR